MPRHKEGCCHICGLEFEVFASTYENTPWVDGKKHAEICHICFDVPKNLEYDEKKDEWVAYEELSPSRLRTVEEMVDDGWDKKEAQVAIRAVKKACRNKKVG